MKRVLLTVTIATIVILLLVVGAVATTSVNISAKELVIAGDTPNFYGVLTVANSTDVYLISSSSAKTTLTLFNKINIGINNLTESGGVVTDWVS